MKNKNNLTGVGPDNPREDNKRARAGEDVERARSEMMATAGYEGGGRGTAKNTWVTGGRKRKGSGFSLHTLGGIRFCQQFGLSPLVPFHISTAQHIRQKLIVF